VLTSAVFVLLVTPLIYLMNKEYELRKFGKIDVLVTDPRGETKH
jgi:Cu(I)/Ag(I) efflux system membrane protein CusA/SilA